MNDSMLDPISILKHRMTAVSNDDRVENWLLGWLILRHAEQYLAAEKGMFRGSAVEALFAKWDGETN